jgi:hypothetical protein
VIEPNVCQVEFERNDSGSRDVPQQGLLRDPTVPEKDKLPSEESAKVIDRYTAVDERLKAIVDAAATPPAWTDAWEDSTRGRRGILGWEPAKQAGPEERLRVFKAARDAGDLPEDAALYLVADQVQFIGEIMVADFVERIDGAVGDGWAARRREGWWRLTGREADDHLEFARRYNLDWDGVYASLLKKYREREIANLYLRDRGCFQERFHSGRTYFYPPYSSPGEEPWEGRCLEYGPPWLLYFLNQVHAQRALLLPGDRPAEPLVRSVERGGYTECTLCVSHDEVKGGPRTGGRAPGHVSVEIDTLRRIIQYEGEPVRWFSPGRRKTHNPGHLRVTGTYDDQPLVLIVHCGPPEDLGV